MKTQKEIEAMANDFVSLAFNKQDLYDGFINGYTQCSLDMANVKGAFRIGYTQCQEDMADKTYTEEDIRQAVRIFFPLSVDDIVKLDKYINSLNKQD